MTGCSGGDEVMAGGFFMFRMNNIHYRLMSYCYSARAFGQLNNSNADEFKFNNLKKTQ